MSNWTARTRSAYVVLAGAGGSDGTALPATAVRMRAVRVPDDKSR